MPFMATCSDTLDSAIVSCDETILDQACSLCQLTDAVIPMRPTPRILWYPVTEQPPTYTAYLQCLGTSSVGYQPQSKTNYHQPIIQGGQHCAVETWPR